jgi:hypothetical protein
MVLITKVASAKAGTVSLKTTIPEAIVEYLQLASGDRIEWEMHNNGPNRFTAVFKVKKK